MRGASFALLLCACGAVDECTAGCDTCAKDACAGATPPQHCHDADQTVAGVGNWECRCAAPGTGVEVAGRATCVLDECTVAKDAACPTCEGDLCTLGKDGVAQECRDAHTDAGSLADWSCHCYAPTAGPAKALATADCVLDECAAACGTCAGNVCSDYGQACRDEKQGAHSLLDWECLCALPRRGAATARVADCALDECEAACPTCAGFTCTAAHPPQTCGDPNLSAGPFVHSYNDWVCRCAAPLNGSRTVHPARCEINECEVACASCENGQCANQAQVCDDPNVQADSQHDWMCTCIVPYVGHARGREAQCEIDECGTAACATCANVTCVSAGQSCYEPDDTALLDWECQCEPPLSGAAVAGAAECELDECNHACLTCAGDACSTAQQVCVDTDPRDASRNDWVCRCPLPTTGEQRGAAALCYLDECVETSLRCITCAFGTCSGAGQNCVDPDHSAAAVHDWSCVCPPPTYGTAEVSAVGSCWLDECDRRSGCSTCANDTCWGAAQACRDLNLMADSRGDWVCECRAPLSGHAFGRPVVELTDCHLDECTAACPTCAGTTCTDASQACDDPSTHSHANATGDWACVCAAPLVGRAVGAAVQNCLEVGAPEYIASPEFKVSPGYLDSPTYDASPRHKDTPLYEYEQSPAWRATPGYKSSPRYDASPAYQHSPEYAASPAYQDSPTYQNTSAYHASPRFKESPAYLATPGYRDTPEYLASPRHKASPASPSTPAHLDAPNYETSPARRASPTYSASPAYQAALEHLESPAWKDAPGYDASPVYFTSPDGRAAPRYKDAPVYDTSPAHLASPAFHAYVASPEYKETPQYFDSPEYAHLASPAYRGSPASKASTERAAGSAAHNRTGGAAAPWLNEVLAGGMAASLGGSALAGAAAAHVAAVAMPCTQDGESRPLPRALHPTGLVVQGSDALGAVVANGAMLVMTAAGVYAVDGVLRGRGVGPWMPSPVLGVFQVLHVAFVAAGASLLLYPENALHLAVGGGILALALALPVLLQKTVLGFVPYEAEYVEAAPPAAGLRWFFLGPGEWAGGPRAAAYASALSPFKTETAWWGGAGYAVGALLGLVLAVRMTSWAGCGNAMAATAAALSLYAALVLWRAPYAKARDNALLAAAASCTAAAAASKAHGYYTENSDHAAFAWGVRALWCAAGCVLTKVVLDLAAAAWRVCGGGAGEGMAEGKDVAVVECEDADASEAEVAEVVWPPYQPQMAPPPPPPASSTSGRSLDDAERSSEVRGVLRQAYAASAGLSSSGCGSPPMNHLLSLSPTTSAPHMRLASEAPVPCGSPGPPSPPGSPPLNTLSPDARAMGRGASASGPRAYSTASSIHRPRLIDPTKVGPTPAPTVGDFMQSGAILPRHARHYTAQKPRVRVPPHPLGV